MALIVTTLYQHMHQVSLHLKYYLLPGMFNVMILKL